MAGGAVQGNAVSRLQLPRQPPRAALPASTKGLSQPGLPSGLRREGRPRQRGGWKEFFTLRVVKPWHRLPRDEVDAPSWDTFKARLDGALSSLIQWKMSLLTAGGLA